MKKSLSDKILDRFKEKPGTWVPGKSIEKWTLENTKNTASNARRRLREMVEDGKLKQEERVYKGVNHAFYCYQPKPEVKKIPEFVTVDGVPMVRFKEVTI